MKYRTSTILARKTEASDVTETIDIDIADPISQIQIIHEATNGPDTAATMHPAACLTKIELVDGSDLLFSLSGPEACGTDWYHNLKEPANLLIYLNGMNSETVYNLNFGRFLWDPLLALVPTKFRNLQLKVTIDVNGGGMATSTGYLTVLGKVFDEKKISPIGFLQHKEIKDYTLADASWEYTDLPTDLVIRKLFLRARRDAVGPDYQLANIKLHEDSLKRVVLDMTIAEFLKGIVSETPPYQEWILGCGATAARYFYCTPAYFPVFAVGGWTSSDTVQTLNCYEGDGQRFYTLCSSAGLNWEALCRGWCPHAVMQVQFGLPMEIDDWYDVTRLGNLKLEVKGAATVGTAQKAQIFLQQLRRY